MLKTYISEEIITGKFLAKSAVFSFNLIAKYVKYNKINAHANNAIIKHVD